MTGQEPAELGPGEVVELGTPLGPGRATVRGDGGDLLVLSHGAGGGIAAPDLVAVAAAALAAGWRVALVEQPWRVAGRRVAPPPPRLDVAWNAMVPCLATRFPPPRLVLGGRSAGARVACRTATALGAVGVVALAFPLHPPRRPEQSRGAELAAGVPVLVVQGERDPFGGPEEVRRAAPPGVQVVAVAGDHSLRRGAAAAARGVVTWLAGR